MEKSNNISAKERVRTINIVTINGSIVNLVLTIFKIIAGIFGRSAAMVADGMHSLSDLISDIVVLVFVRISSRQVDKGHDYGHGKFETLATLIVSLMLLFVGVNLMISGTKSIISIAKGSTVASPTWLALSAAILSIVSKEILYQYTIRSAKRVNSPVMEANAWHHRSDAFSSIGSFIGIGGAMLLGKKWTILDPLTGCVISLLILWMAVKLAIPAINDLVETSLPDDVEDDIIGTARCVQGVKDIHDLKTRKNGPAIIMSAHIVVDPLITVCEAHEIVTKVEDAIKAKFGNDTVISIHIEPFVNSK
ncbi:MAG: cation diffusion facilitator family transporter [Bacteroidales bacterium]